MNKLIVTITSISLLSLAACTSGEKGSVPDSAGTTVAGSSDGSTQGQTPTASSRKPNDSTSTTPKK